MRALNQVTTLSQLARAGNGEFSGQTFLSMFATRVQRGKTRQHESQAPNEKIQRRAGFFRYNVLAERTGLEPATPGVTGRYSNQLNYHSTSFHQFVRLANSSNRHQTRSASGSRRCFGVPKGIRTPVLTVKG
jgi:hypothetical protein